MPSYKSQIPVEDRWAIVAYIRTLQQGQWTEVTDVDQQYRDNLIKQINAARSDSAAAVPAATPPAAGGEPAVEESAAGRTTDETDAGAASVAENQADAVGGNG